MLAGRLRAAARDLGSEIPTSGLIAWYTMDNISGSTLVDEMGNDNGTIYGGSQTPGVIGQALNFNGTTSDGVSTPVLRGHSGGFTLALWCNVNWRVNTYDCLFILNSSSSAGDTRIRLFDYSADGTNFTFNVGSVSIMTAQPSGPCFITATYDSASGSMELKINDVSKGTASGASGITFDNGGDSLIAKAPSWYSAGADLSPDGWIDQLRIYNRALSAAEITALYQEGL